MPDRRRIVLGERGHDGFDGGFGWAVTVVGRHAGAVALAADGRPRVRVDGFAAQRQRGQRHRRQQTFGLQLREHRRRGVDQVDAVLPDGRHQCLGIALHLVTHDVQAVAVQQRGQRLPRRVEGERPGVRNPQWPTGFRHRRAQYPGGMIGGVGQHRGVGADHALGLAGGTRREDDVGTLTRMRW
ncbi:Uncharacterised protein [Mycobacteroides abscessus subsp. abscessus]|nr:Uncharacterised protein [Mycobacteroides abscessus subsp. abscessus]